MKRVLQMTLVLFVLILGIYWAASLSDRQKEQSLTQLNETIQSNLTLCYAQEGFYPASIDYLVNHYHLQYDNEIYYIYFKGFASNIRPDVKVFRVHSP
jgi:hypothetical protein